MPHGSMYLRNGLIVSNLVFFIRICANRLNIRIRKTCAHFR